jgi:hypothetical protein
MRISRDNNINTFRFVGFGLCNYRVDERGNSTHISPTSSPGLAGLAELNGRNMIVSFASSSNHAITTAHEIGHMLGADHCPNTEDCIMNSGSTTKWCNFTKAEIAARR